MTATLATQTARPAPAPDTPVLALRNVQRSFGPIQVLHDVTIELFPGEVHALIGENGAGKSTTMKIMSGYLAASGGTVELDGAPVSFAESREAEARGVTLIHQEFNLAQLLSVEQNIFLGHELRRGWRLDHAAMRARTRDLLDRLETPLDPRAQVSAISVPEKQMVEIAKALSRKARVLIMDEPTAALTTRETEVLFRQIERLKEEGTAILYTSHKLDEVARIADRVTVMRDGRLVRTAARGEMTVDQMAEAMVGRELSDMFPPKRPADGSEAVLEVEGVTIGTVVQDVSFTLRRGEILGFAGLVGSGRTELMEGLIGVRPSTGTVRINGSPAHIHSVEAAMAAGLVYLPEDRKEHGLILTQDMRRNLTLLALKKFSNILIDKRAEAAALERAIREFDIRAPQSDVLIGNLSGGNQQKLLLAKIMLAEPQIVIIDEPTRGIDVGTKQQFYGFIHTLAEAGHSVIVISSEMTEVIGLCDRVIVMRRGRIAGEVTGADVNEDDIVRLAMGLEQKGNGNG
ncbi:sugar ABC transporter ATP-binding protein [Tropicimonas isoalkanivorans]|uniref:Monosaccharide ABC transporter ATP-binding protein, CUT2 family n=1 Tax=Tropicimonas isoalkanivorans TaxID=441112 RepID=A0A1I1GN37_9RHOB|nr:sugar ABC transporter ATP-binding protein [Tropicimonas isoalkanivorans]SFC11298.1 monosaccharide ABC transporter ATP-binding protein, CUT2 family [Tropicimonas isoalkanivorans]